MSTEVPSQSYPSTWTETNRRRTLLTAVAVVSAALYTYGQRDADPDMWGYLTYGRWFLEQKQVTGHDPFAYTSAGSHWVAFEYLAQLLLWVAYRTMGPPGLIALKCLLGGAALYFLSGAIRETTDRAVLWVPVFMFSSATVARFFLFRPQLFTFACFAFFVFVLLRYLRQRRAPLWALPLVMIFWANAHGGFLAGFGAIGLAIFLRASANIDSGRRHSSFFMRSTGRLWLTAAACIPATFINPQGYRLWVYVLTEMLHGTNRRYIAEWAPVSLNGDGLSAIALTVATGGLIVLGVIAQRRGKTDTEPQPIYWVLSCVPVIVMAYVSVRHVPIAAIWIGPVIASLGSVTAKTAPDAFGRVWVMVSAAAGFLLYFTLVAVLTQPRPVIATSGNVLGRTNPCRVVGFIRENRISGNLYNPLWWGSYITWALYPKILVSMDGRNISLFPDAMVSENLRFYTDRAEVVDTDVPLRYDTELLLIPSNVPALSRMVADARWRQIYADSESVLFVRADDRHEPIITAARAGSLTMPSSSACSPTFE